MSNKARLRWFAGAALLLLLIAPPFYPPLLAFPHRASVGRFEVWSEQPIDTARLQAVLADASSLTARSPLYRAPEARRIFLTDGGWRWLLLANSSRGAFAITRPLTDDIIINRNSITQNTVWNGNSVGGKRSLAGIVAHESCHGMERRHFGFAALWAAPTWLREGYCDHVAQESSLSDADYAKLIAAGTAHPALPYFEGRKRVEATLKANGGDVDRLFAQAK